MRQAGGPWCGAAAAAGSQKKDPGIITDALARYLWNVALSQALYPTLGALAVGLRNNLHDELAAQYGPSWFTRPGLLRPRARRNA